MPSRGDRPKVRATSQSATLDHSLTFAVSKVGRLTSYATPRLAHGLHRHRNMGKSFSLDCRSWEQFWQIERKFQSSCAVAASIPAVAVALTSPLVRSATGATRWRGKLLSSLELHPLGLLRQARLKGPALSLTAVMPRDLYHGGEI
jgi:hypothetical protein